MLNNNVGNKNNKKKATPEELKKKHSNNPYVVGGREEWGQYFESKKLPFSGSPVRQAIYNASKATKINPGLLYTSAMEEGLRYGIDSPDDVSEAYQMAIGDVVNHRTGKKQQEFDPNEYPVDGFYNFGLDTFADQYESLKKKGYLPEGFDQKFKPFKALNEKQAKNKKEGKAFEYVNTAAFKSEDDALIAKAAMLRNTRDNLTNHLKKSNITLTDKQLDFFNLVGYNAGEGNMRKMIQSYKEKGYLKDDKFIDDPSFKPASYPDPYTYAQRRIQNMRIMNEEGYFQDYNPNQNTTVKKRDGGFIKFNSDIYNNLYPSGEQFIFNNGGDIYTQKSNGFNPQIPQRKNPFDNYFSVANFGENHDINNFMANDGIHIKKKNKGKFTNAANKAGMSVQEYANKVLYDPNASPLLKKRANFARNASEWHKGNNGLHLPFEPNQVSTPDNPIYYEDPITEAKRNITNYFNDPQNNYVINDASLNLNPSMQGVFNDSNISSPRTPSRGASKDSGGSKGQKVASAISGALSGVTVSSMPFIMGTAALANYATRGAEQAEEYSRRMRRQAQQDVYNPIKYGTGSQAIYNNGGNIEGSFMAPEGSVKVISDNQFGSPIVEFVGPSHENNGIPLNVMGKNVEVEGGETMFMDNGGDLSVFGNMKVPGTNKKFKSVSKNLASLENKIQMNLDKSVNLVNENNPNSKYQGLKFNAGKVMMSANREKLQELDEIKNELSDMQNLMLYQGFNEKTSKKLKKGGKIKANDGLEYIFDNGRDRRTVARRRITPDTETETELEVINPDIPTNGLLQPPDIDIIQPQIPGTRRTTQIQELNIPDSYLPPTEDTTELVERVPSENTGSPNFTRQGFLPINQILPELLTLATERPEFVAGQTYEPNLYTPYQVTFQDRLNENNATFRAMQIANSNNPALMAQLAAQKYEADGRVLAEEFRTNQGIQNQITNQNIELLNQAQQTNLQLNDQQFVRQSQARSNTRENIRNAINSISSKQNQARLEDQTLAVYENMFPHFTFDNKGKLQFQDVDRPVFTANGMSGNSASDVQRTRVKYDQNGKVKETVVTTPSSKEQEKLDMQLNKPQKQRRELFNSIFGKK